jgi:hypothetical protein
MLEILEVVEFAYYETHTTRRIQQDTYYETHTSRRIL